MKRKNVRVFSRIASVVFCLLLISVNPVISIEGDKKQSGEEGDNNGFMVLPVLGSSPETGFMIGGVLQYYFRETGSNPESRPSTFTSVFVYTAKKQITSILSLDLYRKNEEFRISGGLTYNKFPNKFWGIGSDTIDENEEDYIPELIGMNLLAKKRFRPGMYLGLQYEFLKANIIDLEDGGMLSPGIIPGSKGGIVTRLSLMFDHDLRDNIFSASRGNYYSLNFNIFDNAFGSDFNFTTVTMDLRQYFSIFDNQVLALQGYMRALSGTPPFQMLSLLGGESYLRGYYLGRYREKNMITCQMEYRTADWKNIGMVAFAGLGNVGKKFSDIEFNDLKHSVGFGFRYTVSKKERVKIRMDFGFGKNSSGMYITLNEAF
ncbi:MAG: BamA/TamA family outer membrane protein [bacterium]|nr:BamA/TamA family outer membrane protein [bacterium]